MILVNIYVAWKKHFATVFFSRLDVEKINIKVILSDFISY